MTFGVATMSHHGQLLLYMLIVLCLIAVAILVAIGFVMAWFMLKHPAKFKAWSDKTERKIFPLSVLRVLNRFENAAVEWSLCGIALVLGIVGLWYFSIQFMRLFER